MLDVAIVQPDARLHGVEPGREQGFGRDTGRSRDGLHASDCGQIAGDDPPTEPGRLLGDPVRGLKVGLDEKVVGEAHPDVQRMVQSTLRTSFRELGKQGVRPFIVGAVGEIAIALITLGLVVGADRLFHL